VENKPIVVATWLGTEPELPAVLLNSHYDGTLSAPFFGHFVAHFGASFGRLFVCSGNRR
jgi:hypothetical protein